MEIISMAEQLNERMQNILQKIASTSHLSSRWEAQHQKSFFKSRFNLYYNLLISMSERDFFKNLTYSTCIFVQKTL